MAKSRDQLHQYWNKTQKMSLEQGGKWLISEGCTRNEIEDLIRPHNQSMSRIWTHTSKMGFPAYTSGTKETSIIRLFNVFTPEECSVLCQESESSLRPSTTTAPEYESDESDEFFRTSYTSDFSDLPIQNFFEKKLCDTLGLNRWFAETSQIQRYLPGQEFKAHYDWFTPDTKEYETYARENGQRTWTATVYLNNVESGGNTSFPHLNLDVRPETGMVALWKNCHRDSSCNYNTLHAGTPVMKGEKWIMTKWFREKPQ